MEQTQTMKELMAEIKEVTKKQRSVNKVDEIKVMKAMLNDPNFQISVYDKNKGLIGTRCPHEESVKYAANLCSAITGIDSKSATELASNYEFTKKDAIYMIDMSKSFVQTYLDTGRKINVCQTEDAQAELMTRAIPEKEKLIPGSSNETAKVPAYTKIIAKSKNPKYHK